MTSLWVNIKGTLQGAFLCRKTAKKKIAKRSDTGGRNRTYTNDFGDRRSTIKLHLSTWKGIEPFPRMDIAGLEPTTTRL